MWWNFQPHIWRNRILQQKWFKKRELYRRHFKAAGERIGLSLCFIASHCNWKFTSCCQLTSGEAVGFFPIPPWSVGSWKAILSECKQALWYGYLLGIICDTLWTARKISKYTLVCVFQRLFRASSVMNNNYQCKSPQFASLDFLKTNLYNLNIFKDKQFSNVNIFHQKQHLGISVQLLAGLFQLLRFSSIYIQ